MPCRPSVVLLSIVVHAIVLIVIASADLWLPINGWPTPHTALAFLEEPRVVHLQDIALPSSRAVARRSEAAPDLAGPMEAAPIAEPQGVSSDPFAENVPSGACACGVQGGTADSMPNTGLGLPELPPAPPPPPKAAVRLHSGIRPPERLVYVPPIYPMSARAARVQGIVIIEATLDERGNVTRTQILRSIPLLDEAAVTAVRQWKFSPTLLNGVPVSIVMTVTVNFRLTE